MWGKILAIFKYYEQYQEFYTGQKKKIFFKMNGIEKENKKGKWPQM